VARSLARVSLALALAACAREPLPEICPNVEPGALVIAELRGDQEDATEAQWIELYNASASSVDLLGLVIRVEHGDGDKVVRFLIRESVDLPAGGRFAIGPAPSGLSSDWLAYTVIESGDLFGRDENAVLRGYVELEGCDDDVLDKVEFIDLPKLGTLACGNADSAPDAEANDDTSTGCWCVDEEPGGPSGLVGFGTPGEPNRCP
jgi:hypothetical protein